MDDYTKYGCFEYHASGDGIARIAQQILEKDQSYTGSLRAKKDITSHDLFIAYTMYDTVAIEVFRVCVEYWGMAIANLVSIFNPEKIILGGGVFGPGIQFIPSIKAEALKWAQPISIHHVSIEASALGSDAGVYGAGYMAKQAIRSTD